MKTKLILLFLLISSVNYAQIVQNGQKSVSDALESIKNRPNTSYFEVSDEMFRMMEKAEGINEEQKNYISKLSSLKMIRTAEDLYDTFMTNADLKDFSMLMTSTNADRKISFYKKSKNADNQFLVVSNSTIIFISGTIDIKSIQEMEGIMNLAGRAFDM